MGRMRYPSLSLHGIEGAFHGVGAKTVIPCQGGRQKFGKYSSLDSRLCRAPQTPEKVDPLVITYLEAEFAKLNSKNTLHIEKLAWW
jgi:Cys-Gly metallodipeptidase DUG1